jgi:hypothetical protein
VAGPKRAIVAAPGDIACTIFADFAFQDDLPASSRKWIRLSRKVRPTPSCAHATRLFLMTRARSEAEALRAFNWRRTRSVLSQAVATAGRSRRSDCLGHEGNAAGCIDPKAGRSGDSSMPSANTQRPMREGQLRATGSVGSLLVAGADIWQRYARAIAPRSRRSHCHRAAAPRSIMALVAFRRFGASPPTNWEGNGCAALEASGSCRAI